MGIIGKKVLLISVRADVGGGPKHLSDLSSSLKDFNIKVHIAAPNEEPFASDFKRNSSHFIEIPHRKFSLISFLKLLSHAKSESIDIIHSHGRGAGLYSRLLGLFGFKVIHTLHGAHFEKNLTGRVKVLMDRFLRELTTQFIFVSNDEKQLAISLGYAFEQKSTVINNGVNIELIDEQYSASDDSFIRSKYNLSPNDIVFGFLSRLSYAKGIDLFLKKTIQTLPENYKFFFTGDGEQSSEIKELIKEKGLSNRVFLFGETNQPIHFLKNIDYYFSCSRWEGLPISVLEALAVGKVCLLSNVVGHKSINEKSPDTVILYDLHNINEKINHAISNKEKLSTKSKALVRDQFSLKKMSQEIVSQYYD